VIGRERRASSVIRIKIHKPWKAPMIWKILELIFGENWMERAERLGIKVIVESERGGCPIKP